MRGVWRDRQPHFKLATVRNIETRIDWTCTFVFFLIAFNLGAVFPVQHSDGSLALS